MAETYITTTDNPFSFFDEYDQWFQWDAAHGYNTPGLVARVIVTSPDLSEADQAAALDIALNDIVDVNPNGMYKLITKE
jgi:hypothetical protein